MSTKGFKKVFANKEFLKLWMGQLVSNMGDEIGFIGLAALIVFKWGAEAWEISLLFVFASLPSLIIGPVGGVFADRWSRKKIMIGTDIIRAIIMLLILFSTTIWEIYLLIFLLTSASRFFYPARNALIPNIVHEKNLVEANSLSQMTFMFSMVLGPIIATLIIMFAGYGITFMLDSFTYLFSAFMIFLIKVREKRKITDKKPLQDLIDGLSYLKKTKPILFMLLIISFVMLILGGFNVIYTVYIRDVLGMNIVGLGGIEFSVGAGAVFGSMLVGIISDKIQIGFEVYGGIASMGILLILFAVFSNFFVVMFFSFLLGFFNMFVSVPVNAMLQRKVSDEYRGKVFGSMGAFVQASSLLSMGVMGVLISTVGVLNILIFSGLIVSCTGFVLIWSKKAREIFN